MNIRTILAIAVATMSQLVAAQQTVPEQDPTARVRRAMDEALSQARAQVTAQAKAPERNGLAPAELRKMQGIDPGAIAGRFRETGIGQQKPANDLLIFISTSMPPKALQMLGEQAKQSGAVLVLRGLKGQLGKPGAMQETMKALQPVAATGASIQIDPEAFGRYNVTAVPTFVLADKKEESCGGTQCAVQAYALTGDATLEYVLETWSDRGGRVGQLADMYLSRMKRN